MKQPHSLQHEVSAYIYFDDFFFETIFEHYNIIHAIYGLIGSSHPHLFK